MQSARSPSPAWAAASARHPRHRRDSGCSATCRPPPITAAGAAILSLVEHAHDPSAPAATSWLLGGSVALGLLALILTARSLEDAVRLASVYRPLTVALVVGAAVAILAGLLTPAPWLLALLLVAILSALWFFAVAWLIRAGAWGRDAG